METDAPTRGLKLTPMGGLYDFFGLTGWRARRVLRAFAPSPGERVLDVGCGTGALAVEAARAVGPSGRVAGIDPSASMIRASREKAARAGASVDFRVSAIEQLPFEDASFDHAFATLMLHHLPEDILRSGLREVLRVLAPGGRFHVVEFGRKASRYADELAAAGFTGVRRTGSLLRFLDMIEAHKPDAHAAS